ncbi:MAG: lipid-binding SYLF domain-containing protein [Deltaproteobacteria bacterium]|nr:lipid-binding SYLF domain-containing protein [Deltaproteobacteria bacterium]MBW2017396.1 lipid-binding SYLF domain-containing protein [Deltaproteobacteria bacterium]MBW2129439.1 lipid-binding SYLF domain-containing protein [Deltaproteobacteria bacterium]MBW2302978.1 lipid-binding SYLF domain-containing protein [Deltaproteobacteria bacterium]
MKRIACLLVLALLPIALFCRDVRAETKENAEVIVEKARIVLEEMMLSRDGGIPTWLIKKCAGLAIIPDMIKGGFVVGGSYGKGIVMAHKDGKWTGPAFIYLGAGSFGFQIGVQSTDLILVIVGQKTLESFLQSQFKLGADVAVAAGPVGAQATAATEIMLKGGIYSYSRAKGLFAGISLEGAGIGTDFDLNRALYTSVSTTRDILFGDHEAPPAAQELIAVLNKIK